MHKITCILGDGIGPEVTWATQKIIEASGVYIEWETVNAGLSSYKSTGELLPQNVHESICRTKTVLKGPLTTPVGHGFRSINVLLRKKYDLYANIRPVQSFPGLNTKFPCVDLTIFRENTEGLYIGEERKSPNGTTEAIKRITPKGTERILKAAFEYAKQNGKKQVTVVHKANILKLTDGLFLETAQKISNQYPDIVCNDTIVDNMCMQLVLNPKKFDVIVTMNLYGDILSDLCAGLVGGLGLVPSANIGKDISIFEAVHGSAPDIAGKNRANPTALTLSACMMLDSIGEFKRAQSIRNAIFKVFKGGICLTADLGGTASTTDFVNEVTKYLKYEPSS